MDNRPAYGFSHRMRASVEKPNITPSPLDYHAEKVSLASTKAYTFGHRPRTNYVIDDDLPGPGEYFVSEELKRRRRSGYTFGVRAPSYRRPFSHSPGPKYKPGESRDFQPQVGFSFGHRPQRRRMSDQPGPGEYEKFLFKDTPAYSFGVKNHIQGQNQFYNNITPSPLSYHPEWTPRKYNPPAYSFGHKSRGRVFAPIDDTPGPGEYDTNRSFSSSGRKTSFGLRVRND